jgi:hypothetical protein
MHPVLLVAVIYFKTPGSGFSEVPVAFCGFDWIVKEDDRSLDSDVEDVGAQERTLRQLVPGFKFQRGGPLRSDQWREVDVFRGGLAKRPAHQSLHVENARPRG